MFFIGLDKKKINNNKKTIADICAYPEKCWNWSQKILDSNRFPSTVTLNNSLIMLYFEAKEKCVF